MEFGRGVCPYVKALSVVEGGRRWGGFRLVVGLWVWLEVGVKGGQWL